MRVQFERGSFVGRSLFLSLVERHWVAEGGSRCAGLGVAMCGGRSAWAEVFEVDDGGFDDLELGGLSECGEGFANTGGDVLGAEFGSAVDDDLRGADVGADGL